MLRKLRRSLRRKRIKIKRRKIRKIRKIRIIQSKRIFRAMMSFLMKRVKTRNLLEGRSLSRIFTSSRN